MGWLTYNLPVGGGGSGSGDEVITKYVVPEATFTGSVVITPDGGLGLYAELIVMAKCDHNEETDVLLVKLNGDGTSGRYSQTGLVKVGGLEMITPDVAAAAGFAFQFGAPGDASEFGAIAIMRLMLPSIDGVRKAAFLSCAQMQTPESGDIDGAFEEYAAGYSDTAPITSITVETLNGANFYPGSTFLLKVTPA